MASMTVIGADYGGPGGDRYQNLWNLWWVKYSIFTLHSSPYLTNLLFYPVGANLVTHTLSPIAGLVSIPFQQVGLVFAYNIILVLGFVLSSFFAFLLIKHLIHDYYGAFLGGLVFGFSPMHLSQTFVGHLNWVSIEFVPLFILFFLLLIEQKKIKFAIGTSASFLLVLFFGDPEQGIITTIFGFLILVYYSIRTNLRSEIINKKFPLLLGSVIGFVFLLGFPFFLPIINSIQHGVLSQVNIGSTTDYYIKWSTTLRTIFLPSFWNLTFVKLLPQTFVSNESVAYLGYLPLILLIYGLIKDRKNRYQFTVFWIFTLLFFLYLSMGPYPRISDSANLPIFGFYRIYKHLPILNIVREPGRFDLMVTLALASLSAFGLKQLLDSGHLTRFRKFQYKKYITAALAVLILVGYVGVPFSTSYSTSLFSPVELPQIYYKIGHTPGNFSVLILPTTNNYAARAMYYQTAFKKPIIEGYTSRENSTQLAVANQIPLVTASNNLLNGFGFSYNSSTTNSFGNTTMFWLSKYNVTYVSIINGAYNSTDLKILQQNCINLFGPPIYQDNSTTLFQVQKIAVN